MTDQLGQRISEGSTIAYPSRKRAKMWLRTLRVLHIDGPKITGLNQHGRAVTIRRQDGADLVVCAGGVL